MLETIKAKVAAVAAAATLALGGLAITASPADASAFGCSGYGPSIIYQGVRFPKGTYCVHLVGQGRFVDHVYGQAHVNNALFGTTCNWNITAEFFDQNGNWYETINGPFHATCFRAAGASDRINVRRYMRTGFMCSTLKSNGVRQTSVCHSIKP